MALCSMSVVSRLVVRLIACDNDMCSEHLLGRKYSYVHWPRSTHVDGSAHMVA